MFNPFKWFGRLINWFTEEISVRAKVIISLFVLMLFAGMGIGAYKINNYFETNPNACMMCHVHDQAQKTWAKSVHHGVTCHECHHATKKEQVLQIYKFAVLGRKTVTPRHGAIIVARKICSECHWERNPKYPNAPLVNRSPFHAKHAFIENIECTKCHGYMVHQFLPEERFCLNCHKGKDVHGTGMEKFACLNCHTDRTMDLKPERKKCLFCHGSEQDRKELIASGSIDVKYFQPSPEVVNKAHKINVPADAPMQFYCYVCHKPHAKVKPDMNDCLKCHRIEPNVGKHDLHIKTMNMKCMDCHKPHQWRVTVAQAKKDCIKCHEYRDPKTFIGS